MENSLSNFVDNLAKGIYKINANMDIVITNVKRVELNSKIMSTVLNTR